MRPGYETNSQSAGIVLLADGVRATLGASVLGTRSCCAYQRPTVSSDCQGARMKSRRSLFAIYINSSSCNATVSHGTYKLPLIHKCRLQEPLYKLPLGHTNHRHVIMIYFTLHWFEVGCKNVDKKELRSQPKHAITYACPT